MRRLPAASLAILLLVGAVGAAADEFLQHLLLPLEAWSHDRIVPAAMVTLPPGWSSGDAVVIVVAGETQDALRDAMIAEQAGVVELVVREGCDATRWFSAAVQGARRDLGAGLLVAIGIGCAGGAALQAAEVPVAAAVALEGGRAHIAPRTPPSAEEGWESRAPLLCAALAALPGAGEAAMATCLERLAPPAVWIEGVARIP